MTPLSRRLLYQVAVLLFAALLVLPVTALCTTSPSDLPPPVRSLPMEALLAAFTSSFESPSLPAEIAGIRAWVPPGEDTAACLALVQVITRYPGTSDARRALLDIAGAYARAGDMKTAEAPFRYIMESFPASGQARIAHLRLVEAYRYGPPVWKEQAVEECQLALRSCQGTPEEGLALMLQSDLCVDDSEYDKAFAGYEEVLGRFPEQPYASYVRIRYSLALTQSGKPKRAEEVVARVLDDPIWGGRAHYARARARVDQGQAQAAISDFEKAALSADSLWFRSESYRELADLYAARGESRRAQESLRLCLSSYPLRKDDHYLRLRLIRSLYGSGAYLEAAQNAAALQMDLLNAPERYPEAQRSQVVRECDNVLDACEGRLRAAASPGSSLCTGGKAGVE